MANPIIDAINWDVNNPGASAILLQTQLALLQAEWDTKISRFLQLTAVGSKSVASFQDLPNHRENEIDLYVGLDPAGEFVDSTLRYVRGELNPTLPYAGIGHKERVYLSQTSVLDPSTVNTTFLYNVSATLPRQAYVRGFHPLILKSFQPEICSNIFRPQIDGVTVFSDVNLGITFYPSIFATESFVIVEWVTPAPIAEGTHVFRMDIIDGIIGVLRAQVAPFFDIYTSSIHTGTMPIAYVQPSLSYLEFIYQ